MTVADAFHWFDRPRALAEIRRVLRPGGGLALFNTIPDWGGASWAHELGELVANTRPDHPNFDGRPWQEYVRDADGYGDPWEVRVTTYPTADLEGVVAHMASISWIAALPDDERAAMLGRMRSISRVRHDARTPHASRRARPRPPHPLRLRRGCGSNKSQLFTDQDLRREVESLLIIPARKLPRPTPPSRPPPPPPRASPIPTNA